jgi:hypothetical protein
VAEASGHRFGQALGEWCELSIEPLLRKFAKKHGLYLDKRGNRPARRGKKVKWVDGYGNAHDLDYVLERGGTDHNIGTPVAFIESAWRRYTKHSRNKAQEIQGAVLPLRDKHHYCAPFMGCFLAGIYTSGALEQLRSLGFHLLYFEYISIIEAFKTVGIDASFDETTPDDDFAKKQRQWERLTTEDRSKVWRRLLGLNSKDIDTFMSALERAVHRQLIAVRILPLHGTPKDCSSVQEAIEFVHNYQESRASEPILKYEVQIRYDNGDRVDAQFQDREAVIEFLGQYRTGNWTPITDDDMPEVVANPDE